MVTINIIPISNRFNTKGHNKFIFCFTTAYSVDHSNFGFLKSTNSINNVCKINKIKFNINAVNKNASDVCAMLHNLFK